MVSTSTKKNKRETGKKECSEWSCNLDNVTNVTEESLMKEVTFEKDLRPVGEKLCRYLN